jgi:xanthine dehydrogenase YagS FAD-binding subunit
VSVAAGLELEGNTVRNAALALGGVAHKPWRDPEAEALLIGKPADRDQFAAVANAMVANARPYRHNGFKVEMAKRAIIRALETATEGSKQ